MNRTLVMLGMAAALVLATVGVSDASSDPACAPTFVTPIGPVYVVERGAVQGVRTHVVLYLETDGVDGLQVGGADPLGLTFDTCGSGNAVHDQLLECVTDPIHCGV